MNRLFPNSTIDLSTPVLSVISESRASVNSGILKKRTKNLVIATECVLWSNRGDEAPKVNNPVAPIGNVSDMIASEATKIKNKIKKKKKKSVTEKNTTSKDTEVMGSEDSSNIPTENIVTNVLQNDIMPVFVPCSCHPAELCMMKTIDSSTSLHKCFKCSAKIFAICAPQFEDTLEVLCRNCVSDNSKNDSNGKKKTKKTKRKRKFQSENNSSDEDLFVSNAKSCKIPSRRTGTRKSMSRSAAISSTNKNADIFSGTKDYHDDPELLFQSQVHR